MSSWPDKALTKILSWLFLNIILISKKSQVNTCSGKGYSPVQDHKVILLGVASGTPRILMNFSEVLLCSGSVKFNKIDQLKELSICQKLQLSVP